MKKLITLISFFIYGISSLNAQSIPATSRAAICKCLPAGWSMGAPGGNNYTSNTQYVGSNQISFVPVLPQIPSGSNTFITIFGGSVQALISGLVAGQKYKFNYSVISAKTNYSEIGIDYSQRFSEKIRFILTEGSSNIGQIITLHEVSFDPYSEVGVWKSFSFEFKAQSATATLTFENLGGIESGFVGLDLGASAVVACNAGVNQVPLQASTAEIVCPATSLNLVTTFFGGLIPNGSELRFFDNPTHSNLPLNNLNVGKGIYYAFFYDGTNNCYNTDYSTAKVEVTYKNCVDLNPTIDIDGLSFNSGTQRDFVVNLNEINGRNTSGNVSFRLTKVGGFTITYPSVSGVSNVFGGTPNENKNWTFTENASFITATSTTPIPANGTAVIGFNIVRKAGIPTGVTQNITPTVLGGAGGDANSKNNSVVTSVSTN